MARPAAFAVDLDDIGCPMFPSCFQRLTSVDLRGITMLYYGSGWDFFDIVNELRYRGFRGNLNDVNKPRVLGRQITEAAWLKTLLKYFKKWPVEEMLKTHTPEERRGNDNDDVEAYWIERAKLCEGLDIECVPDDTDDDHSCLRKIGPNGSWMSSFDSEDLPAIQKWREENEERENEGYESSCEGDDTMDLDEDPNDTVEEIEQAASATHGHTEAWVEKHALVEKFEDMEMSE